jgi:hypothetical protein
MALFNRMEPFEQAHSLKVVRSLLEQGENDADLLCAGLLHDVGKVCRPLRLWERTWIVGWQALFPARSYKWGAAPQKVDAAPFWRRPFVVAEQHAEWGAALALQAGVSPRAAALIGRHHARLDGPDAEGRLLWILQSVDDES